MRAASLSNDRNARQIEAASLFKWVDNPVLRVPEPEVRANGAVDK